MKSEWTRDPRIAKIVLKGRQFGKLTVIECDGLALSGKVMWKCQCACGNTTNVRTDHLRGGKIKSCGKCYQTARSMVLKRYGRLTVIEQREGRDEWGRILWFCRCDCGAAYVAVGLKLRNGTTRSCARCGFYNRPQSRWKALTRATAKIVQGIRDY